jgi:Domain of unknown function (DUF4383)
MKTRYFALIYGIVSLLVGIAGFIPGLVTPLEADPSLAITASSSHLFGLFPVNLLHNLVHVAFGIGGLVGYRDFPSARLYARVVAIAYAVLTVMGLIPGLKTLFGLVPLYGHDVWLHALLAIIAAYFGFVARPEERATAQIITHRPDTARRDADARAGTGTSVEAAAGGWKVSFSWGLKPKGSLGASSTAYCG